MQGTIIGPVRWVILTWAHAPGPTILTLSGGPEAGEFEILQTIVTTGHTGKSSILDLAKFRPIKYLKLEIEPESSIQVMWHQFPDGVSPAVLRGSVWYCGSNPPTSLDATPGDYYLDTSNGNIYRLDEE